MSEKILNALIALVGILTSALVSWFVSRNTANKEIEKMKLSWDREDIVSSEDDFAEMSAAVSSYISSKFPTKGRIAAEKVAYVRAKETGELACLLDDLHSSIVYCENIKSVESKLSKVLEKKREIKSGNSKL